MHAHHYLDVRALAVDEEVPSHAILGKVVHILHGAFAKNPGHYALAFPESRSGKHRSMGHVVRVFAESTHDLYALIEKIKDHHLMRDYTTVSMPKAVPDDFTGTTSVWRRHRVQKQAGANLERSLERAHETMYIEMVSSSGHVFPLRIYREIQRQSKHGCSTLAFTPNSYGLASKDNVFALPDLP